MGDPKYVVNVEGVVPRDDRYLVIRRSEEEDHAPGTLSVPGGEVETDEATEDALETALRREIVEEVGIEAEPAAYLESKTFPVGGALCLDAVFLCRYVAGTPHPAAPEEVAAVEWMTIDEIRTHPDAPAYLERSIELAADARG